MPARASGRRAGDAGAEPGIPFPMRLPFIGTSLGGAIFYDGGNVYSRLSRISFHGMLPEPTFALQNPALPRDHERAGVRHELHQRTQLLCSHHWFGREV